MKSADFSIGVESVIELIFLIKNATAKRKSRQTRAGSELQLLALLIVIPNAQTHRLAHVKFGPQCERTKPLQQIVVLLMQLMKVEIEQYGQMFGPFGDPDFDVERKGFLRCRVGIHLLAKI